MEIGNEKQMEEIRQAMLEAEGQKVGQGGNLNNIITLDYTAESGKHYSGKFLVKRPTVGEYMKIGGLKSQEFQKAGVVALHLVDPIVRFFVHVVATLKVVVVKAPEWFVSNIDNIEDPDVLNAIYEEWEKWENSFRKDVPKASDGDSKASESTQVMED